MPMSSAEIRLAKSICYACPVRKECLIFAISTEEHWGVWGGLTASERARLRRSR